jgi:hypothetical protein
MDAFWVAEAKFIDNANSAAAPTAIERSII